MFGSSKRAAFKPSVFETGSRRRHRRMPPWVGILFTGVIIGAGGYWFLQTNYGPKRLSLDESNRLTSEVTSLSADRQRLQSQLELVTQERNGLKSQLESRETALSKAQSQANDLSGNLALIKKIIPADPSNSAVGIRVGEFDGPIGKLNYSMLLMKKNEQDPDLQASVQFSVYGRYRNGRYGTAELDPFTLDVTDFQQTAGTVEIPPTMTARRVTVKITDVAAGKVLTTRTFQVSR
ncbi:membrane protein [Advenella kashmirensis W13003]|uniref:Membrane protein n=1 Tax=Advenella kashmirensis W13003 TaxID=1424334 RepID=V8QNT9_9BURK|nr:membrane protein [Advenella kashmirensis]ETF01317.1 membrane protein [Advenella kashmirensis W13003]